MTLSAQALDPRHHANQFMNENSASVLNTLANTCLAAGYLSEARKDYQKLVDWPDPSGDPYREDTKAALLAIGDMQGTPVPSATPGT